MPPIRNTAPRPNGSSTSTIIDLTQESPPTHAGTSASTSSTHIHDWASVNRPSSVHSRNTASSSSRPYPPSHRNADAILIGSDDDDDDDDGITLVGHSAPDRSANTRQAYDRLLMQASAGTGTRDMHPRMPGTYVQEGIPRGPYNAGSRIPQTTGILRSASLGRSNSLGALGGFGRPASTAGLLGGGFEGFSLAGFSSVRGVELISNYLQSLRSYNGLSAGGSDRFRGGMGDPQQGGQPKIPLKYDSKMTHDFPHEDNIVFQIIEPPIDLDTYFDDKTVTTGPLPDTTPICAGCHYALVTSGSGDHRMWVLPCGHVIDGRCIDRLSGIAPSTQQSIAGEMDAQRKGKARAIDASDADAISTSAASSRSQRSSRVSARTRAAASKPIKPPKPKKFQCPVPGCDQMCSKEQNTKVPARELFV